MFWSRFNEFFEAPPNGMFAIRNLGIFVGLIVGSFIVLLMTIMQNLTEGIYAIYMASCGGVYMFGKWQDDKTKRSQIDADTDPPIVPQTVTNITHPAGDINVAGDAAVTPPIKTKRRKR